MKVILKIHFISNIEKNLTNGENHNVNFVVINNQIYSYNVDIHKNVVFVGKILKIILIA